MVKVAEEGDMVKVRVQIDMVNGQSEAFIVRLKEEGDWYGDGEGGRG